MFRQSSPCVEDFALPAASKGQEVGWGLICPCTATAAQGLSNLLCNDASQVIPTATIACTNVLDTTHGSEWRAPRFVMTRAQPNNRRAPRPSTSGRDAMWMRLLEKGGVRKGCCICAHALYGGRRLLARLCHRAAVQGPCPSFASSTRERTIWGLRVGLSAAWPRVTR